MHPWPVDRLNAIEECIVFSSATLSMGGGKEKAHGYLVIFEHKWNPFCTDFTFPPSSW
jgi:hypothetical protein